MARLKTDDDVDLIVAPHVYTDEDRAAIRDALAKRRQSPGYARAVAALRRLAKRLKPANAMSNARAARKKPGRSAA